MNGDRARLLCSRHGHFSLIPQKTPAGTIKILDFGLAKASSQLEKSEAGIIKGKSLGAHRPWIVVGSFIFAAVMTPSGDPFTMTFMAVPMVLLFFLSEGIARFNDRRRARNDPYAGLSPDELSPL